MAKANAAEIYVAIESGSGELPDGRTVYFKKGQTRFAKGHAALAQWPEFFAPVDAHYGIEDATDEPGRKRGER